MGEKKRMVRLSVNLPSGLYREINDVIQQKKLFFSIQDLIRSQLRKWLDFIKEGEK